MSSDSTYDAIVIGIGGMGSAATYHLAKRGLDVLGLEQFNIPHNRGSSHGDTRIIRLAYHEHPFYVPLLFRAYELWEELQDAYGQQLLYKTGSIAAGPAEGDRVDNVIESCERHGVEYELMSSAAVNETYPGYQLPEDYEAVYQPDGGFVTPEQCIAAHVERAHAHGAEIHGREKVLDWRPTSGGGVKVRTNKDRYEAEKLVVTAGAWASKLLPALEAHTNVERRVMAWLQPERPAQFTPEQFPVFTLQTRGSSYYGFPVFGVPGFKFGRSPEIAETVDPDAFQSEEPTPQDEELLRGFAEEFFPAGAGPTLSLETCMLTMSPDDHFIVDRHTEYPQVTVGAGFSGHGFKLASVVGELLAQLTTGDDIDFDIETLSMDRLDS
ncbi:MAG: N-methyl-L-tryptophan oxidase [Halobacteriales archaeon]|nr:N-methyl-L-tryptophan oxidase [Halobacteriales archaeon]